MRYDRQVPKVCGADVELGSHVVRAPGASGAPTAGPEAGEAAARAVLAHIAGVPAVSARARGAAAGSGGSGWSGAADNPQDLGRKFLPSTGGSAYLDLGHLELALPEVTTAADHVAAWHGMLRIAADALQRANEEQPPGQRIHLVANNSAHGHSWGSHLNVMISRHAFDDLIHRRLQLLLWLASYQVSSIVFAGAGKVGSEGRGAPAIYQVSARADFMGSLVGLQTTSPTRPLVNTRDEPLSGEPFARLHVIFFDSTLAHVASFLKIGVLQVVLAMLEAERVDLSLVLEDPLSALGTWSRDLTLAAKARTIGGQAVSAVTLQMRFLEQAARFVASGGCDGIVPGAEEIIALWAESLEVLQSGNLEQMARRFDWALKLSLLSGTLRRRPDLGWGSAAIKHLDHAYASVNPHEGLFWACERAGQLERVVDDARIERFVHEPPDDTRAWTRAHLLRRLVPETLDEVDWDFVRWVSRDERGITRPHALHMKNPLGLTGEIAAPAFARARTLPELTDALDRLTAEQDGISTPFQRETHDRTTPPRPSPVDAGLGQPAA